MSIVNISAYKFIGLDDLPALRERLLGCCENLGLKGTILLAPEGINIFLAGSREMIDRFMTVLHGEPRFADIEPKESFSDDVPFGRMRVRLKREIITMRLPTIRPEGGRAPAIDAATLRRWLDQGHDDDGREVMLLDTRNDYETDVGKFPQAVEYRLASFTEFPAALAADRARYEGKTIVSYCTGGIRCEKAVLHMRDIGIEHAYQLDGGILKYLEQTDGAHWQGECFVFDNREALDADLLPLPLGETTAAMQQVEQCMERLPTAGVRGQSGGEAGTEHALMNFPASTRSSPQPSPPRGDGANARSTEFDESAT